VIARLKSTSITWLLYLCP